MNTAANITASYLGDRDTATNVQHNVRLAGETMLALVWHGKENVRVEQVPIPTITEPKDAIVRITGTTVCGSDLHLYHGEIMQLKGGDILGHEFCGEVVEVGADVKAVGVGERVVASFQIAWAIPISLVILWNLSLYSLSLIADLGIGVIGVESANSARRA
jgi:Alcohol dehydrogenase GroES-like domain/Alcohol dehydrogenase GroES-associated